MEVVKRVADTCKVFTGAEAHFGMVRCEQIHEAAEMCMPPGSSGSALLELCYLVVQIAERQSSETENDIDSV